MELTDTIYKRQSCRHYEETPLSEETLNEIKEFIDNTKPLFEEIKVDYKITDETEIKSRVRFNPPHYVVLFSEEKEGYLTNIGFIFQQLDLFLQSKGLGSCWVGMADYTGQVPENMRFVIIIYFGKPSQTPYRELEDFKRKELKEISDMEDEALKPAQYAPSAINSQPWYFTHDEDTINVYQVVHNIIKRKLIGNLNKIDMGICLAHLYVTNKESFNSFKKDNPKDIKGYDYLLSVKL